MRQLLTILFPLLLALVSVTAAGDKCSVCVNFVDKYVQAPLISSHILSDQLIGIFNSTVCPKLSADLAPKCISLASADIPTALRAVEAKYLDGNFACGLIGLCSTTASDIVSEIVEDCLTCSFLTEVLGNQMTELFQSVPCDLMGASRDQCLDLITNVIPPAVSAWTANAKTEVCIHELQSCKTPQENGISCPICELVVDELDSVLQNNTLVDASVETILEKEVCGRFPAVDQAACGVTVAQEVPSVINSLADTLLNSETDCALMRMCDAPSTVNITDTLLCSVCSKAVDFIANDIIKSNVTLLDIEADLNTLCTKLPVKFADVCAAGVDAAAPSVISNLQSFLQSQGCVSIAACAAPTLEKYTPGKPTLCPACKAVITDIQSSLENSGVAGRVANKIESEICMRFPVKFVSTCNATVTVELPKIMAGVAHRFFDAEKDCAKLCPDETLDASKTLCEICEKVVNFIDEKVFENPAVIAETSATLDHLCSILPASDRPLCKSHVNTIIPDVFSDVAVFLHDTACQQAHACK